MSQLPTGWVVAPLDAVADVLDFEREPVNSSERESRTTGKAARDLYPYFGATGQVGFIDSFRSEGERVLLGEDAAPFLDPTKDKAYLATGRFWVNNHAHVLSGAGELIHNRFLCYQLNVVDYHPFVTGSTRLKLTSAAMRQIPLVVAPAAEQTRIVAKLEELLSDLDAGVAELKAAQKKLQQYRQSLLKAAVEGALTAPWREAQRKLGSPTETGAQLLQRILTERRARWEAKQLAKFKEQGKAPPKDWQKKYSEPVQADTGDLPGLPEGWVWASLDQLCHFVRNGLSKTPNAEGHGHPILRINAVRPLSVQLAEFKHVEVTPAEAVDYTVEAGDLLATRYNGSVDLLGVVGLVRHATAEVLHPDKLIRMKPVIGDALPGWIEMAANTGASRQHIVRRVKTTAGQTGIAGEDLKKMPIPLPSLVEQNEAVSTGWAQLEGVGTQVVWIEHMLKQSTAQRQNILRAAFAGQLVPQDPNDEPASVLLERIRAERDARATQQKPRSRQAREPA